MSVGRLARLAALVAAVSLAALASGSGLVEGAPLMELNHENFTEYLHQNPYVLVSFYAPWCGHCKKLEPKLEKVAARTDTFKVVKFDADNFYNKKISRDKYDVKSFPRVIAFAEGSHFKYQGPREEGAILGFLKKLGQDTVLELPNEFALTKFPPAEEKKINVHTSFVYLGGMSEEYKSLLRVARDRKDTTWFGRLTHPSRALLDRLGVKELPAIVAKFDGEHYRETEVLEVAENSRADDEDYDPDASVREFVDSHFTPPFHVITPPAFGALRARNLPVLMVVTDKSRQDKVVKSFSKAVADLIPQYRDRVSFAVINGEEYHSWLYYEFGVDMTSEASPALRYILYQSLEDGTGRMKQFNPETKNKVSIKEEEARRMLELGLSEEVPWTFTGEMAWARNARAKVKAFATKVYKRITNLYAVYVKGANVEAKEL
ncbi:protein disulfide isomerase [Chloropicon primus]|uniref:protein disulfide-isomerase n=1 Tax=Chloropicon primus TaxID=1764295 RepID=A0A5B8MKM9_9CHLO|nr:protein disulfide isomerase [Chloropicon primus]UPR00033.1 protein disulfide isomerase [Chloropicon primus]|mmetsp:Transcript_3641/g.10324  ORF Transcript_3641/g.10324 Transcript_3641/m.10324 type:complete len:433 (-) Transcript_3641:69-1367(-)|eukprot:QDZ20821.1 protein disulfide isomerase [Chloropicon primus]